MSNHLSKNEIDRYYQRSLSPAEIVSIHTHLESCEACREKVGRQNQFEDAFMALGSGLEKTADQDQFHLSPELGLAYSSGEIGEIDAQIVESHIEDCASCSAELQDLKAFETQSSRLREDSRMSPTNPWRLLKGFWLSSTRWRAVQAASLLVLLLLIVTTISLQNQIRELSIKLAELESVNNSLRQEISSLTGSKDERPQLDRAPEERSGAPAEIAATLNDGGKLVTLERDGDLSGLVALPAHYERLVRGMLTTGDVPIPSDIAGLAGKRERLMGTSRVVQPFTLLSPVGVVVLENRPTFRWTALQGVSRYTVDIFDADSNKVASSGDIDLTQWSPPHELPQGRIYIWQVTAIKDGKEVLSPAPPAPQARFKVLDRASAAEIRSVRSKYARSHLLLGGIYAHAGLLEDAEREFKALLSANADSTLARKLLQRVQTP